MPIMSKFCEMLYNLRGYSAQVESLFSSLSLTKSKCCSSMLPRNMKMLGVVKDNITNRTFIFVGNPFARKLDFN
jgi:hypothetical protein